MIAEVVSPITQVTIYTLVDRDSGEVRYVGRTPPKKGRRPRQRPEEIWAIPTLDMIMHLCHTRCIIR